MNSWRKADTENALAILMMFGAIHKECTGYIELSARVCKHAPGWRVRIYSINPMMSVITNYKMRTPLLAVAFF